MQEEMNKAMSSLNETVGDDVPSLKEVQDKIEARYAKAKAMSELREVTVESRILEIEQATANVEAQSRLSQLRGRARPRPAATPRRRVAARQPRPGPAPAAPSEARRSSSSDRRSDARRIGGQ